MKVNDPNYYEKIKINPGKYYIISGMFLKTTVWDFINDDGDWLYFRIQTGGQWTEAKVGKKTHLKNRWIIPVKMCNKCVYENN